jgi:hypothetical protein
VSSGVSESQASESRATATRTPRATDLTFRTASA